MLALLAANATEPSIAVEILTRMVSFPGIVFVFAGTIAIVAIVFGTVTQTLQTREREQTRREIAAYLAEGMIDSDTAEMLLKRGKRNSRKKNIDC
ncbi:MAG: hypothetical protein EA377_03730 [Phycisphaerales bacterium]|nr:MAG: hypothetical protein EA377_03730 [Phycisphaerales bacterium]